MTKLKTIDDCKIVFKRTLSIPYHNPVVSNAFWWKKSPRTLTEHTQLQPILHTFALPASFFVALIHLDFHLLVFRSQIVGSDGIGYASEHSEVDAKNKRMEMKTRNVCCHVLLFCEDFFHFPPFYPWLDSYSPGIATVSSSQIKLQTPNFHQLIHVTLYCLL